MSGTEQTAKYIAHRGSSHKKKQNTVDAFIHASESAAYGIETDVRITKDGVFIAYHDKSAARLGGRHWIIEKTDFEKLRKIKIYDRYRRHAIPTFTEFLQNCILNSKVAIVEIKSDLTNEQTDKLIEIIDSENYLPSAVFVSFNTQILTYIRSKLPNQSIQLLLLLYKQEQLDFAQTNNFGININHRQLSKDRVDECHRRGIEVNCWTVNKSKRANVLMQWGVDYITTDKLHLGM